MAKRKRVVLFRDMVLAHGFPKGPNSHRAEFTADQVKLIWDDYLAGMELSEMVWKWKAPEHRLRMICKNATAYCPRPDNDPWNYAKDEDDDT